MLKLKELIHLEVVKWLHETRTEGCSSETLYHAAYHGHLAVVEWLYENVDVNFRIDSAIIIAKPGQLELLQWLQNHFPGTDHWSAINVAASIGDLELLKWLHKCRYESCTHEAPLAAAYNGHLRVIQWLHRYYPNKFHEDRMLDAAAQNGHLDIVRWLHENNIGGYSTNAMGYAAANGHLDVVLYLLENRNEGFSSDLMTSPEEFEAQCLFSTDSNSHSNQVNRAQLNILQSIFKSRPSFFQYCLRRSAEMAVCRGLTEILDWVKQFGLELRSTDPILKAACRGDVKLLQWFYRNGFKVCKPDLLELAIENNILDAAHWLLKHRHTIHPLDLDQKIARKKEERAFAALAR